MFRMADTRAGAGERNHRASLGPGRWKQWMEDTVQPAPATPSFCVARLLPPAFPGLPATLESLSVHPLPQIRSAPASNDCSQPLIVV